MQNAVTTKLKAKIKSINNIQFLNNMYVGKGKQIGTFSGVNIVGRKFFGTYLPIIIMNLF